MKDQELSDAVQRVVRDVFENMYYMFPEMLEAQHQPPVPKSCFNASVEIKNSPFRVVLYGSEKLVQDMAAAVFGSDRPMKEDECVDIFREATNLVGGNLVNAMDLDKNLALGVPEVRLVDAAGVPEAEEGAVFDVDGEFFKAVVLRG